MLPKLAPVTHGIDSVKLATRFDRFSASCERRFNGHFVTIFITISADPFSSSYFRLRNAASGPEIGFPGRISARF